MFFEQVIVKHRRIHFVGIGGIGMSGIAEILLNLGYEISGSDLRRSPITDRLEQLGATVFEGHVGENIRGADAVVVSSAISSANPESLAAREAKIPIIKRGELLAELMRLKYGIAVGGSHGKTTTTSIAGALLAHAGKDPTVVVGGRVDSFGSNARLGKSDILLVEADESDGSFLNLAPIVAVITNVDREHMDHYHDFETLESAFVAFADKTPFYGAAILCLDDPILRGLLPKVSRSVRTYGSEERSPDADLIACGIKHSHLKSSFRLRRRGGEDLGVFEIAGAGRHNVLNATAAVSIGLELEIAPDVLREGLKTFSGVDRRFQLKGERGGVSVLDDYGHHPSEIEATLAAARTCDFNKVHVIFQPHRYSRTHLMEQEFANCFRDCDTLQVLDIYAASEDPIPGVNSVNLTERIRAVGDVDARYADSIASAIDATVAAAASGDVIVTLGAGNVGRIGGQVLEALAGQVSAGTTRHAADGA